MAFSSFSDFLNMGGYAFFVWLSYGFTALLLIVLSINSGGLEKKLFKQIKQRLKRESKLKQAAKQRAQQSSQS